MQKRWKIKETNEQEVEALQQSYSVSPLISRLLVQRDINTAEKAEAFFNPSLQDLHDPFLMKDMQKAVDYLHEAIDRKDKILIYGDYDVDGTTSVALLYNFVERRHSDLGFYIPDRYIEGYGLSIAGIDFAAQAGYQLIITVDCGIKAVEQVKYAKSLGISVIICDHHLPGEELPPAVAILDPKQKDCPYPYKHMSGCGIAFKFVQAFQQENNIPIEELRSLLDYVVISTASDIVPLTGENRILAHHGLKQLNHTHRPGLLALIQQGNLKRPMRIRDIVFGLAPIINAAGRLSNAQQAVNLMLARNRMLAREFADELEVCNQIRREFDQKTAVEAEQLLEDHPEYQDRKSIILFQPHWHKGVIGIVASRIAEKYHKPTIILTQSEDDIVGSARSVSQFDIHEAIESCSDMLINFGGHKYAAGMTMSADRVGEFQERIEERVSTAILPTQQQPEVDISAELELSEINMSLWDQLSKFAPFGPGNMQPVFICKGVRDSGHSKAINGKHLKLAIKKGDSRIIYGVIFNRAELLSKVQASRSFDICFILQKNGKNRRAQIQLIVQDIRFPEDEVLLQ
ncbi:MAG: single-stranded-DNA-specific exonuclease RecJ [Saprospiraceae bacterium]